ncbi:MAG: phosphotransferase [Ktedonobacteraceae bacterium]|nr:phosphotransferase [Ktedonobacteraceae bacterium]
MLELPAIWQAWDRGPILATTIPASGTVHRTLLLRTATGEYALRAYRYPQNERERVEREHALIAYVQARGIPAVAPIPFAPGETILEHNGRFYALFPYAVGKQVRRGELTRELITEMGSFLAMLHSVLRDYPHERVAQRSFTYDSAGTLAKMDGIEAVIRAQSRLGDVDMRALARLEQQQAWLRSHPDAVPAVWTAAQCQVIHGDYQETNLFFEGHTVSAIIDWDQAYIAPRAWEVLRTLHYVCTLEVATCRAFLDGYRRVLPLSQEDLEEAAAIYGMKHTHDTWLYESLYLKGNRRVEALFSTEYAGSGLFVSLWPALRDALSDQ